MRRTITLALVAIVLLWVGIGAFAYLSWSSWLRRNTVRGSGRVVKQARPISGVTAVECAGPWEVDVTQGKIEALEIEAEDNVVPLLTTTVTDGRLVLASKAQTSLSPTQPVRFHVTVKNLTGLQVTGSGSLQCGGLTSPSLDANIHGSGDLTCRAQVLRFTGGVDGSGHLIFTAAADQAKAQVHGSGLIDGTLQARTLEATIEGSGEMNLTGSAPQQTVTIGGSGEYHAEKLDAAATDATITGSGTINVGETAALKAQINGSGEVTYLGIPSRLEDHINGSGSIRRVR